MARQKQKLTPVELVIARFAAADISIRCLGRLLGKSDYAVHLWRHRKLESIPSTGQTHQKLLALASERKIRLTPDELINGGAA